MTQTPKEKAEELVYKFMDNRISWKQSKLCALIAVDEILNINSVKSTLNFLVSGADSVNLSLATS